MTAGPVDFTVTFLSPVEVNVLRMIWRKHSILRFFLKANRSRKTIITLIIPLYKRNVDRWIRSLHSSLYGHYWRMDYRK